YLSVVYVCHILPPAPLCTLFPYTTLFRSFLVAQWGVEKFRQVLEDEYLESPLQDGIPTVPHMGNRDHVGVHKQQDGKFYVGVKPDRKSTRLNSCHVSISYAVFCLKKTTK